jgi:hypothetical protein
VVVSAYGLTAVTVSKAYDKDKLQNYTKNIIFASCLQEKSNANQRVSPCPGGYLRRALFPFEKSPPQSDPLQAISNPLTDGRRSEIKIGCTFGIRLADQLEPLRGETEDIAHVLFQSGQTEPVSFVASRTRQK